MSSVRLMLLLAAAAASLSGCVDDASLDPEAQTLEARYCPDGECDPIDPPADDDPPGPEDPTGPEEPTTPSDCSKATGSLSASATKIDFGGTVTLAWSASLPPECTEGATLAGQWVPSDGSMTVKPLSSQYYTLLAGGRQLGSVYVDVTLYSPVRIQGSTREWRDLLIQAVQTDNMTVLLAQDVDMDMSWVEDIRLGTNVVLRSEKKQVIVKNDIPMTQLGLLGGWQPIGPEARTSSEPGPRLYTNSRPPRLFRIDCRTGSERHANNVRISGFRLQGPHWDPVDGDDNLEKGIVIDGCKNVEIANMEISGWSSTGVMVYNSDGYIHSTSDVKIHDNFVHHNQHVGKDGYGVALGPAGRAQIYQNVFDFNRHAIKASGESWTSYAAENNLVLQGGGYHAWYKEFTHQLDVHGTENCYDVPFKDDADWGCGQAGDEFFYTGNTVQYTNENSIKIRGVPEHGVRIQNNVFALSQGDALSYKENVTVASDNQYGRQTFGTYGQCDFDGDGQEDLFLATGVSWWFAGKGGKMPWTYLGAFSERLDKIGLGDFDGDRRCDVFTIDRNARTWLIAKGGKEWWTPLPGNYDIPLEELRFHDFNADGVTDVFWRQSNGQWWTVSPGRYDLRAMASSSFPLSDLRFGDFDGDGYTDVLGRSGGKWAVSWRGTWGWSQLNPYLNDPLGSALLIGNVDGQPGDDILRYVRVNATTGRWDISNGGRTTWKTFATKTWPSSTAEAVPSAYMVSKVGYFDAAAGADLLTFEIPHKTVNVRIDGRIGMLVKAGQFLRHSLYWL